jgi:hypothetical protein
MSPTSVARSTRSHLISGGVREATAVSMKGKYPSTASRPVRFRAATPRKEAVWPALGQLLINTRLFFRCYATGKAMDPWRRVEALNVDHVQGDDTAG